MKKKAVIYDKWLDSMGGGEVVACTIAKILSENNYNVTLLCRKKVPIEAIKNKLNIDLKDIKFVEVWNDESKIQTLTEGKDLFINISFIDYSIGHAKKNIYYTHFPTSTSINLKSYFTNNVLLPIFSKYVKPIEFINPPIATTLTNNNISYLLGQKTTIALSYLDQNEIYNFRFYIFHEQISKTSLESTLFNITNSTSCGQNITLNNRHNVLHYDIKFKPKSSTVYFNFFNNNDDSKRIYLIEPKIFQGTLVDSVSKYIENKIFARLRAGIFNNVKSRINTYDKVIVHSQFVANWVRKYWKREAIVIYPPVEMLFEKYDISKIKKKNYICSVGRFFTLGHGKRQDIMIEAFQKMCDKGLKNWQLHLAGGLGSEPTSVKYMEKLQKMAIGYPIVFHINKPRKEIEDLYKSSKIYWHAAGYGINQNKYPIKLEHFGITPIEAMSCGCVPVLFNGGGLSEVIILLNLDPKTHLFNTIDQLASQTKLIIDHRLKLPSNTNQQLESLFGIDRFKKQFKELISTNNQQTKHQ